MIGIDDAAAREALDLFLTPRKHKRPAREQAVLVDARPLALPSSGLSALTWGAGPTVLLLHGWEGRGTQLAAFIAPLVAAGKRVVALDGPAHGDSPGTTSNLWDFALGLEAAARDLGPLDGVIAHSMGAAATAIALARGLDARRVVLIAGPATLDGVLERFSAAMKLSKDMATRFRRLLLERTGIPHEYLDGFHLAARMTAPALIVHDDDDRDVPVSDSILIAATWPRAVLHRTTGLGHRRVLQDSSVVAAAVDFLITKDDR